MTTKEIGIVMYKGVQQATVLGIMDLFTIAQRFAARHGSAPSNALRITQWFVDPPAHMHSARRITTVAPRSPPDVLIMPPSLDAPVSARYAQNYTAWLKDCHRGGSTLASICAGAFLLGETGLLNARRATTHWQYRNLFQDRFPQVKLDIDRLIINDGDIITAGGLMAWTDLGLLLVEKYFGAAIMIETAQMLLVDPAGRQQNHYSAFTPRLSHGDAAIEKVQQQLENDSASEQTLHALAALAGLEERTFLRRFKKATGMTVTEYVQRLRIERARQRLQHTALPVERIAWEVGYSDASAFRKVFSRIVGLTPGDYRQRFRARA